MSQRGIALTFRLLLLWAWAAFCLTQAPRDVQVKPNLISSASGGKVAAVNITCVNVEEVILEVKLIRDIINNFKDNYAQQEYFNANWTILDQHFDRSRDNISVEICDLEEKECMYVLPTLPPPPYHPPHNDHEVKNLLVIILGYIQRYTIAFETLFMDQSLYEDVFLSNMSSVHANLEDLIESLVTSVSLCDRVPNQLLIGELSVRMYKGGNTVLRNERGFRVLRQTLLGLQYIIDVLGPLVNARP
ncbi:uncharacterized protein LOC121870548 [Homarus americanus]|uniref:Uncharacterized protein n=1 Tax=Homarus americanus TaxID=6706 RepID=A0A8J5MW70_HOMAM|nr:uncharacterized protein LOC121870548 [Homarus americanus]XP_042228314.1 uncharacterized protein LOC121870548 [Homarus americanus]XP_042228315.1 uncharacterized protein LOC121870548 [Homarus americanus]KAG7165304.1 hypothetical protein Hamer_G007097 [Homarus americanus]